MPSKAFKLAEAMVSNPVMSDMVENPTATPTQIAAVETKTATIGNDGVISVSAKNITTNNTLTQSFDSNQIIEFNLTDSINSVSPLVSVFKEVPVTGVSSKGQWDVNANATNYEFFDEKPYSTYASSTLTPSATGDGTFTNSNAIVVGYQMSSTVNLNSTSPSITGQGSGGSWQVVEFDPTGNHVYMVSGTTQSGYAKTVYQYTMSTPHDLSTLNTTPVNTLDMSSRIAGTIAHYCPLHITNSGYDLYFGDYQNDIIYQWKMSTAYDLSTASYHGASSAIFVSTMASLFIQPDGLTGYQVQDGIAGSAVLREFTMTTAWDITTASLSGTTSSTLISRTQAVTISPDGTLVIASDAYGSTTSKYFTMSPGYDLSSLSSGTSFTWQGNSSHTTDTRFSSDGALLYGWTGTYIYNYTTGTTAAFNAADVGKKVVGNSGSAIITGTSGTYKSVTAFADTSAISSWQLFGAQGKSDGSGITLSGYGNTYDLSNLSYDSKSLTASSQQGGAQGMAISTDGTSVYTIGYTNDTVYQYTLTTAFDLSTASYANKSFSVASQDAVPRDIRFKPDGTIMYVIASTAPDSVYQYTLSTAWDVSTASYANKSLNVQSQSSNPAALVLSPDGTKVYVGGYGNKTVFQYNLSTAWDLSTGSYSNNSFATTANFNYSHTALELNSDASKLFVGRDGYEIGEYNMPSDGNVSNASYVATYDVRNTTVGSKNIGGMAFGNNGAKFYIYGNNDNNMYQFSAGASVHPYSTYSPALTNSSTGQINSASWLDINSMTADETKNGGDIFYAVSTDNRTSWSVAKGSDGVRKIAKNNSGTWQYNNDGGTSSISGYDLDGTNSSAFSSFTSLSANSITAFNGAGFSADGTKLYVFSHGDRTFYQFTLSTAWDETTASYASKSFTPSSGNNWLLHSIRFNSDGTKMYAGGEGQARNTLYEYTLTTAWDISTANATATGNLPTRGVSGVTGECENIQISPNGSYVYALDYQSGTLHRWSLNTAWDLSSRTSNSPDQTTTAPYSWSTYCWGFDFSADGSKLYIINGNPGGSGEWDLSTSWSISGLSTSPDTSSTWNSGAYKNLIIGNSGLKLFGVDQSSGIGHKDMGNSVSIYGTSETWVNGTNNNEHATLQQALTSQAFNRMDKAQLDAVADDYHFSQDSADTLDLMIAPYATSGISPISDGVTINYDAEALVREAIPGTDYVAEFPNSSTINIKSLVNANIKVRAL